MKTANNYLAVACCLLLAACGDDGQTLDSVGGAAAVNARPGRVQFTAATFDVNESAGNATITLTRIEGSDGQVSVVVSSRNGTATTTPADYTAVSVTVTFAAGDSAIKTVSVPINNDTIDEADETVLLSIASASGGVAIGTPGEALLTIVDNDISAPVAPSAVISAAYKRLHIDWTAAEGATAYRVMRDPNNSGSFTQVGADVPATQRAIDLAVAVHREPWPSARYQIAACNSAGCTASSALTLAGLSPPAIGYLKAPQPRPSDSLGGAVAISDDGSVLAVGAPFEDGTAAGVGGTPNTLGNAVGAVYVYTRTATGWSTPVYIKASNPDNDDQFGTSVALSADGNVLAVGAPEERSNGSSQADNSLFSVGAVYVYIKSAGTWIGPTYIKAPIADAFDNFGSALGLNADGTLLAVGAPGEDGNGSALGDNSAPDAGAVYVYTRTANTWSAPVYVKASNVGGSDLFGTAVALSTDGNTLAVGATGEDGGQAGVNPTPDEAAADAGAAYIYTRSGSSWGSTVYLKASNPGLFDQFGTALAISANGNVLTVGAPREDGGQAGVGATPDETASAAGAAYIFTRDAGAWSAPLYVKGLHTGAFDEFGDSLALSDDGATLAVGAHREDSIASGVIAAQDESAGDSGIVFTYVRSGTTWSAGQRVKASNPDLFDNFGTSVALTADGSTLAVGANSEESAAAGFNGNQQDDCDALSPTNCASSSGAIYIY